MWGPSKADIIGFVCALLLIGACGALLLRWLAVYLFRHLSIGWL